MASSPLQGSGARSWAIWVCDGCGDLAECEPGETCEVCVKGTIRSVEVVPRAAAEALAEAIEALMHFERAPDAEAACIRAVLRFRAKHPTLVGMSGDATTKPASELERGPKETKT